MQGVLTEMMSQSHHVTQNKHQNKQTMGTKDICFRAESFIDKSFFAFEVLRGHDTLLHKPKKPMVNRVKPNIFFTSFEFFNNWFGRKTYRSYYLQILFDIYRIQDFQQINKLDFSKSCLKQFSQLNLYSQNTQHHEQKMLYPICFYKDTLNCLFL